MWTVREANQTELETFLEGKNAILYPGSATIVYDPNGSDDLKLASILHEIGHEMFPEWAAEPHEKSKSELGVFERDCKAFLEAFGVDLSPLLKDDDRNAYTGAK